MKWQVAMWLALVLQVAVPVIVAEEPKPADVAKSETVEAEKKPDASPPVDFSLLQPPDETSAPKPTSHASGLIYIQPGTGRNEQSSVPLDALLRSTEVQKEAIAAAAKKHLEQVPEDLKRVEFGTTTMGTTTVRSFDERLRADWVLEALKEGAENELVSLDDPAGLRGRLANAQRFVEGKEAELVQERERLFNLAKAHNIDVDPRVAAEKRLQLATEIQRLEVEKQGLKARHDLLEAQFAQLVSQPADDAKVNSEIVEALEKSIASRVHNLDFLLKTNEKVPGTVSKWEIERAKGTIAEAEIELAKFRRESSAGSSQRAVELRRRLEDAAVEQAEIDGKLELLGRLFQSKSRFIEQERLTLELDEQEYRRARRELDELRAELQRYEPPRVLLIRTK